jgi:3-hydroxyisobutyrate dehydrogenase
VSESVGFIGIGIMGGGMVRNLAKAGLKPLIWNRTRRRLDEFSSEGFEVADDPAAVAAASDVVITCVSDTPDVEKVILGERGVLEGVKAGSLVIDMSTISPRATATPPSAEAARGRRRAR